MLLYNGYIGETEYDEKEKIFSGIVANTKAVITFQGRSMDELVREFHNSIDDYLEWCKKEGVDPEIAY